MQAYADEPAVGAAVVLRCAAALLIVVILAVTGATGETSDPSIAAAKFHRWQLADRQTRQEAVPVAPHTQAARAGALTTRRSNIQQPAGALAEPLRN